MAAHQAPRSLGFSRQEHWSGNLILHLKQVEKEEQKKNPKISGRKEIIKVTAEINEIETKKTIAKINEA